MKHLEIYLENVGLRYLRSLKWDTVYTYGKEWVENLENLTQSEKEKLMELFFWKTGGLAIADIDKFIQYFGIEIEPLQCLYTEQILENEIYLNYRYDGIKGKGKIQSYGYVGWIEELGLKGKDKLVEKTGDLFPEFKMLCIFSSDKAVETLFGKVEEYVEGVCDKIDDAFIGEKLLNDTLGAIQKDFDKEKNRRKGVNNQ